MSEIPCTENDHTCCLNGYYPTLYYLMDSWKVVGIYGCLEKAMKEAEKKRLWLIQKSETVFKPINRDGLC